ncbi:MAG: exosortase-associated EpsI family protein [Planctomycetota bacterium]
MARLLPIPIAVVVIAILTIVEGVRSGRWVNTDVPMLYAASLLDQVPTKIGSWEGQDDEVESNILVIAGAEGYVSRDYRDTETDAIVNLWLIVGHAHDTAEHTPDFCYPSQGYPMRGGMEHQQVKVDGLPESEFWTAVFEPGEAGGIAKRVFWGWFKPTDTGEVQWVAPEKSRWFFGNTPVLFKVYFTSRAEKDGDEVDFAETDSVRFAREFLREVSPLLAKANQPVPEDFVPPTKADDPTT